MRDSNKVQACREKSPEEQGLWGPQMTELPAPTGWAPQMPLLPSSASPAQGGVAAPSLGWECTKPLPLPYSSHRFPHPLGQNWESGEAQNRVVWNGILLGWMPSSFSFTSCAGAETHSGQSSISPSDTGLQSRRVSPI